MLRRNDSDFGRELCVCCGINWPVLDLRALWVLAKKVVILPVLRRSDWARNKPTTAVWADVAKNIFDARCAERALVGANACFEGRGRQRLVAVLTGWSKFKHKFSFPGRLTFS